LHLIKYIKLFFLYGKQKLIYLLLLTAIGTAIETFGLVALLPILNVAFEKSPDPITSYILELLQRFSIDPSLGNLLILLVLIFVVRGFILMLQRYLSGYLIVKIKRDVQLQLFNGISEMDYEYFSQNTVGYFNNVVVTEVGRFVSSLGTFIKAIVVIVYALIYIPAAMLINLDLTLFLLVIGFSSLFVLRYFTKNTANISKQVTELNSNLNAHFVQLLYGYIYLKSTNSIFLLSNKVKRYVLNLAKKEYGIIFNISLLNAIKEPIAVTTLAVFTYYQIVIVKGNMAEVMVFSLLLYRLMMQLLMLPGLIQNFNRTIGGVESVMKLTSSLDQQKEKNWGNLHVSLDQEIRFNNVSLDFDKSNILKNINLSIKPNQSIGIVGESGSGKTTFFNLLTGLLRPTKGAIYIGPTNYDQIDIKKFRENIGYVTQEPIILNDTAENNIGFFSDYSNSKEYKLSIANAARIAQCQFIEEMPEGMNTILGERGVKISGGQKQRIAIARELQKNPKLLILDEATSSLDAESEKYIQEEIIGMTHSRTMIIIAHRLSTVMHCDLIYVFSKGEVVESGSFEVLYNEEQSLFRKMCNDQGLSI
jgi:ABC-type multidrug transport system fused ATPase/permease subunit